MIETNFNFKSLDNVDIHVYKWAPNAGVRAQAVIQLVHGSVEHALRYKDFASYLVDQGYIVYANDHRGHGKTAGSIEALSYFSDLDNGFDIAVDDLYRLNQCIRADEGDLKVYMLGHSLGSFMLRKYASEYSETLDGMILTGTGGGKKVLLNFGLVLANHSLKRKGRHYKSQKLHKLMYGPLNKNVKDKKTDVDFISRDPRVIDAYMKDAYCGHTVTTEYALESMKGIKFCNTRPAYDLRDKTLPIYMLSGQCDLVGGKEARGVKKVLRTYKKYGMQDIDLKLYAHGRHEILNEINKKEVYNDIHKWLQKRI